MSKRITSKEAMQKKATKEDGLRVFPKANPKPEPTKEDRSLGIQEQIRDLLQKNYEAAIAANKLLAGQKEIDTSLLQASINALTEQTALFQKIMTEYRPSVEDYKFVIERDKHGRIATIDAGVKVVH